MPLFTIRIRLYYAGISMITIAAGLLSRSSMVTPWVPLSIGDLLYATLIYFITSAIIPDRPASSRACIALSWCITIELLQLVDFQVLLIARKTLAGRLVLGQGFLWSDFIFYGTGVIAGFIADVTFKSWLNKWWQRIDK